MFKFILVVIIFFYIRHLLDKKKKKRALAEGRLYCDYKCQQGNFKIEGIKNDFTIKKNGRFEFLIKDGQIVACKDKRKNSNFVYYGGEV